MRPVSKLIFQEKWIHDFRTKLTLLVVHSRLAIRVNPKIGKNFGHDSQAGMASDTSPVLEVTKLYELRVEAAKTFVHAAVQHDRSRLADKVDPRSPESRAAKMIEGHKAGFGKNRQEGLLG